MAPRTPGASIGTAGPKAEPSTGRCPRRGLRGLVTPQHSAGRNLSQAIPVGVGLGAIVLLGSYFAPLGWYLVVAGAVALATWEVSRRLREAGYTIALPVLVAAGQAMVWLSWPHGAAGVATAYAAGVLVLMVARLFWGPRPAEGSPPRYLRDLSAGIFLLSWIPLCGSFAAMICLKGSEGSPGSLWVVSFMLCVVANDVGGYAAGVFAGRHPLAPSVSPKKSWEGFAGSIVAAGLVGTLCAAFLIHQPWWAGIVVGAMLAMCATMGDLVESQVKRDLGIKDMSALIPGHGGLMDRLDGVLPAAAVTWLLLTVMMGW